MFRDQACVFVIFCFHRPDSGFQLLSDQLQKTLIHIPAMADIVNHYDFAGDIGFVDDSVSIDPIRLVTRQFPLQIFAKKRILLQLFQSLFDQFFGMGME